MDENEPWLLIGIPNVGPFILCDRIPGETLCSDQHMEKLMSLLEDLHVMMQCYIRPHVADRYWLHEHPRGHASWREPNMSKYTNRTMTCAQMECSEDAIRMM